jgi:hypothetical protein
VQLGCGVFLASWLSGLSDDLLSRERQALGGFDSYTSLLEKVAWPLEKVQWTGYNTVSCFDERSFDLRRPEGLACECI